MVPKSISIRRSLVTTNLIPSYYTRSHGADVDALRRALGVLVGFAEEQRRECAIAVGVKSIIRPGSALDSALPAGAAVSLSRGAVQLNAVTVHLITKRITPREFRHGPILALYLDSKYLEPLFDEGRVTALIYVPWTVQQCARFISAKPGAKPIYP